MKVRSDVAELLYAAYPNAVIVERTGAPAKEVAAARRALHLQEVDLRHPVAPQDRLYAEALPTGRVRDFDRRLLPITPAQAAANRRILAAAITPPRKEPR